MNLNCRPLNTTDSELLIHYFKTIDYHHQPEWQTCFCNFYHNDCDFTTWLAKSKSGDNEVETRKNIASGVMRGYLVFDEARLVGWLNANHWHAYLRLIRELQPHIHDPMTAVLICFVIDPEYRHQGVARRLMEYALQDLKVQGYKVVLGLPRESVDYPQHRYRGTFHMYQEQGFVLVSEKDDVRIYRKIL